MIVDYAAVCTRKDNSANNINISICVWDAFMFFFFFFSIEL